MQLIVAIDMENFKTNEDIATVLSDLSSALHKLPSVYESTAEGTAFVAELRNPRTGLIHVRVVSDDDDFETESLADPDEATYATMNAGDPSSFTMKD